MIPVTKPFLPPQGIYHNYLNGIWKRQWLTNMEPLASDLEMQLKEHLDVQHLLFVTNGTVALQFAIKALELKGEIITTPFSFVATTSSIVWECCTPVFVDIDSESLNIDADKIEAAIMENTSAILATHVYGNPCDVVKIEAHPKTILFYADSNLIGENEQPYSNNIQKFCADLDQDVWHHDHQMKGTEYVKKYLKQKNFILNASSVVFGKNAGLKNLATVENFKTSGDWLFWALLLSEGDVYFSSKKLNYFRHLSQSTRNYNTLAKREQRILEKNPGNCGTSSLFRISGTRNRPEKGRAG